MISQQKINIFWFRRDLRILDNRGLNKALASEYPVLPLFIFDTTILNKLDNKQDGRVSFIYDAVCQLQQELKKRGSSLLIKKGRPLDIFHSLQEELNIAAVYTNKDYEPYAKDRDRAVAEHLHTAGILFHGTKDQVIFEEKEIVSKSGDPYKVFTPYSKVWLSKLDEKTLKDPGLAAENFLKIEDAPEPPPLAALGFSRSQLEVPPCRMDRATIRAYDATRDFPYLDGTSRLGIHLRHGTISIRNLVMEAQQLNSTFLNELIWRDFYMMILDQHPQVVNAAFKPKYDRIPWKNNEEDFKKWCDGMTGIPIVDAGMRQLNKSGFMHNRLRMITASFLTKNLLIDWRWGEAYFAAHLLDFELSSNNGGWQWAAGSGVDAQPYFRVFNPESQAKKWDPELEYIKRWIPEYGSSDYPDPMVNLKESRAEAIAIFKKSING